MSHRLETVLIDSPSLGRKQPVNFLVPDQSLGENWNTLFLLHGMGGDHTRWAENCDLHVQVNGKPILLVMPSCENSFYLDSPAGHMESFITQDLISFVDSTYPTLAQANSRSLTGYSMGGYGALVLALRNPHLFGSAASHSGAVLTARATHEIGIKWELADILYGVGADGERKRSDHDILTLARRFLTTDPISGKETYSGPSLYLDCGTQDFLYYASRELTQAMRLLRIPYEYHESPGDHNWEYWVSVIWRSLKFHRNNWHGNS